MGYVLEKALAFGVGSAICHYLEMQYCLSAIARRSLHVPLIILTAMPSPGLASCQQLIG
jgi:hypothetical protein